MNGGSVVRWSGCYQDNIRGKDMEPPDIVRALSKLIAAGLPIANEVHVVNHWR